MELFKLIIFEKYKKLILLSFFIFGIQYSGNCQVDLSDEPYKIEKTTFSRDSAFYVPAREDYLYTYNEEGKVINFKLYHVAEDLLSLERIYEYQDGRLLFSIFNYFNVEQEIARSDETIYSYNDTCLVLKVATAERTDRSTQVISTYDSVTCNIILEDRNVDFSGGDLFIPVERYEWEYNDNKKEETKYQYSSLDEEYFYIWKRLTYYDNLDRKEAEVSESVGSNRIDSTHYSYAYEDYSFPTLEESYRSNNGFFWEFYKTKKVELKEDTTLWTVLELNFDGSVHFYDTIINIYHYNDQDLRIKREYRRKSKFDSWYLPHDYTNITIYEYDCEGRLVKQVSENNDNYLLIYKYFYEEEITCEEQEYEEVNESITVFPNPTYYYIDIQGDLIKQEGTKVELFDMKGTNIPVTYNDFSTDKIRIFLEHLYTGVYVIRVTNRDQSAVEVFIKK